MTATQFLQYSLASIMGPYSHQNTILQQDNQMVHFTSSLGYHGDVNRFLALSYVTLQNISPDPGPTAVI